jgi:hypothetical protein
MAPIFTGPADVGVGVAVGVTVGLGVAVGVAAGVTVGLGVAAGVEVTMGVVFAPPPPPPHAGTRSSKKLSTIKTMGPRLENIIYLLTALCRLNITKKLKEVNQANWLFISVTQGRVVRQQVQLLPRYFANAFQTPLSWFHFMSKRSKSTCTGLLKSNILSLCYKSIFQNAYFFVALSAISLYQFGPQEAIRYQMAPKGKIKGHHAFGTPSLIAYSRPPFPYAP